MYLLFYVTSKGISVIYVTVQMYRRTEEGVYSELIGSKNDNIQVLPSEIQEFPSTS